MDKPVYIIVDDDDSEELAIKVNAAIANGYAPQGGISVSEETVTTWTWFYQAMMLRNFHITTMLEAARDVR